MMVKDHIPLLLISQVLDRLANTRVYTKLDIWEAYHNLQILEQDEWKPVFHTRYGLHEYLVIPFGLTNAPAPFQ
jgi:hypothetical protein